MCNNEERAEDTWLGGLAFGGALPWKVAIAICLP
jgi:hypothetical protein